MQDSPANVLAFLNTVVRSIGFLTVLGFLNSVFPMQTTMSLSNLTRQVLQHVFSPEHSQTITKLLVEECSPDKVHSPTFGEAAMERIWLAVLKISEGDPDRLLSALMLAQTDWRDLLMSADFGRETAAHTKWADHVLD